MDKALKEVVEDKVHKETKVLREGKEPKVLHLEELKVPKVLREGKEPKVHKDLLAHKVPKVPKEVQQPHSKELKVLLADLDQQELRGFLHSDHKVHKGQEGQAEGQDHKEHKVQEDQVVEQDHKEHKGQEGQEGQADHKGLKVVLDRQI